MIIFSIFPAKWTCPDIRWPPISVDAVIDLSKFTKEPFLAFPIFVFDNENNLKLITGSPGGSKIPDINLQVVLNVVDFGLDIGAATMMPRIHQDYQSVEMDIEKFLNFDTRRILKIYGHKLEESDTIGSTQSILIDGDSKYGYADLRRPNAKVSVQK